MELKEGSVISIFNVCLSKEEGTQVHAYILKAGHLSYVSVGNALISMCIRNGELEEAYEIFLEMPERDAISWTAIMAGLANEHRFKEALETFQAFRKTEMQVDQHSATVAISVCTSLRDIDKGRQIHALSLKNGLVYFNITRASFINMYAKHGHINCAAHLFSYPPSKGDLVLTNVMLSGYCWNFQQLKAFELFRIEYQSGLIPDQFSLSIILGACADMKTMKMGMQIHSLVVKCGFEFSDIVTGYAIINMYIKSEDIPSACKFYYSFRGKSNVLREMLMAGYISYTGSNEAINVFGLLQRSCFHGNPVAFARVLKGCEDLESINFEKRMHASIKNVGIVSDSSQINTTLGLINEPCLLDRAVEDTHVLPRGDNATSDSNVFRIQEDEDEDKMCFLGCSKEERTSANFYDNGIDFYAVALSGTHEASSTIKVDFQEASEVPSYTKFSTISNRLSVVSVL
ncbi:hypothetical protein HPP92_009900 [Vanilla planifolia]|uniref:Pentatricopeptide repeat-containing protein n=1 Tax=Vanilla planifolia TaxID=51239 RepID=A0A835RAZ0_VANPL|nr:hypothetical protein HPP92_009900 [Vanilla planifolia]